MCSPVLGLYLMEYC